MRSRLTRNVLLITFFVSFCYVSDAQVYKFRHYGINQGLCHYTINSIVQDKYGFIWFASGLGLCRYDGIEFTTPEQELPTLNVTASFKDKSGNLWFGYDDGLILKYDGLNFSLEDTSKNSEITQIIQSPKGDILATTLNGSIVRISEKKVTYLTLDTTNKIIYSICFIDENRLFIGCLDGLFIYRYDDEKDNLSLIKRVDVPNSLIRSVIPGSQDNFWVATEEDGIYSIKSVRDDLIIKKMDIPVIEDASVQSVNEDDRNDLWISTFGKGLFRVQYTHELVTENLYNYNYENGLGSDFVKQVFFDNQQNLWVGTMQGVSSLTNRSISFLEKIPYVWNNASAIYSKDNTAYWAAGIGAIVKFAPNPDESHIILNQANGVPNDRITALHMDKHENLWIGTEKSGLFRLPKDSREVLPYYRSENSLSNTIQAITSVNDSIVYASRNGVVIINTQTGGSKVINTFNGLPHNNIKDIYKDSKGIVWIATSSNSVISINKLLGHQNNLSVIGKEDRLTVEGDAKVEFTSITEGRLGNIWAGTDGNGVYMFDRKNDTVYHFTSLDGLKSDYCYAISSDKNNHVWIGHRQGLSRINIQQLTITTYGKEDGITGDVNPNTMLVNESNELMVGLTDGVLLYDINADESINQAPILNLINVTIGDQTFNPNEPLVLPYDQDKYKVHFNFVGLHYRNPEAVTYQYILEGFEKEWSHLSSFNFAIYPSLADGEYKFWVKSCNGDDCTDPTLLFTLKINKPFWKTWWFILLVIGILVGIVYIIITIRERNHRIQQEYLERELDARTKEVLEQKEEIEEKNRDITDSINYAQRIQFSVLPSTKTLLENCSGAFIFYRPRDIVSGDFYWFEYFPETECLLIVCADSTGHGVPGAFMSLIGTTLIKDIVMRPEIQTPKEILYRLDENIQSTLNQNQESEQANDGMDIVVCEINTRTYFTRISSAMRPFVVYHDGVPTTYKGSHSSIGGQQLRNKTFEQVELQLSKGDIIYMFTDGYPDQFGGPAGKKFKMNRLQSVFEDIHNRDMDEQYRVIKENFDLWKGNIEQLDDVLMIGVKI
ncbi:MAG: SpoIIE family protein phosphatase [Bacteroidales bacterium]|nr:SpoIIE family protein phosphatase [Bacteroidales bacterium]